MTLSKLSLRNARRQARDYLVYFATIVMAAALLYAFNGLVFSDEVRTLSHMMETLPLMLVLASIVVVCIFGWLVSYATGFMLLRRSRELGTYILIGLENRQVARLFFLENLAVGGCALLLGLAAGGLFYQALRAIVLTLFHIPYHLSFGFSLPAAGLTLFYFAVIYLRALRKSRKHIRKMKIYDLIYFDRQNETDIIRTDRKRRWLFAVSILSGIAGTCLLIWGDLLFGTIGAGCLIFFLYGFFLSFASGVPAFFDRRPARKYSGQNLLVFRTLTAKLSTMGVLMATLSLIFTATLIAEGTGMVFHGLFAGRAAEIACFDLYIGIEDPQQSHDVYLDYISKNIPVDASVLYQVYLSGGLQVRDYITARTAYYYYNYDQDPVLRYSDYAALRSVAGYRPVSLEQGQYLIHCMTYLEKPLQTYEQPLVLGDMVLHPGGIYTERLSQSGGITNGRGYILVVPDEAVAGLPVHHRAYAARTRLPVTPEQFDALYAINTGENRANPTGYDAISAKSDEEIQMASQTAVIIFPLYFLALALTMTAATILTIQQLGESQQYRKQFLLLQKLGMDRREMTRTLRTQFAIYYAMPAVPPVLIGGPFILHLAHAPEPGVMTGASSPAAIIAISLALFFLIYAVYIILAYTSLKRNVLPDTV